MTTTALRCSAVLALSTLLGAPTARADCAPLLFPVEAAFDVRVELPRNAELRFVDPTGQIQQATLSVGLTAIDASLVVDELGTLVVPAEPLAPGGYSVEHTWGAADFRIGEADDVTAPAAPPVSVQHDPPLLPFRVKNPFYPCPTPPPEPEYVLHVEGDDGDIVIVDGEARVVVRDGNASVRVSRRTVEVQLRDFAGNTSEVTTLDLTAEGGCSQGGSASSLTGFLVLLGLFGARRRTRSARRSS